MTNKQSRTSIMKSDSANLQLFDDSNIEELIKASAVTGVKSKGEFLMIAQKANELGIGFANAISHMHVVNGKAGIDIHIVKAILSKPSNGITWEKIDDYKPLYNYSDGVNTFTYDTLPENYIILPKLSGNPNVEKYRNEGKIPVAILPTITVDPKTKQQVRSIVPIDYSTTYKFTRLRKQPNGEWIKVHTISNFKWSDAIKAKLPLDKTGNINSDSAWGKYPKLMIDIRAFTYGARDIASDLLLGNYETSEILDMNDIDYDITEEGTTTIIDNPNG